MLTKYQSDSILRRTQSNAVSIIEAFCPHLGADLTKGGKVINDCLECPFHNWAFSGDGVCQSIPYSKTGNSKSIFTYNYK